MDALLVAIVLAFVARFALGGWVEGGLCAKLWCRMVSGGGRF